MAATGPVRAFPSYAHEDFAWRDALLRQLGWLINGGELALFYDPASPQAKPGTIGSGQSWTRRRLFSC